MKQEQTKQKKQDSSNNRTQQTGQSSEFSKPGDHQYLHAQGIIGNHGILRRHGNEIIQAKLKTGQPNDKYEQEADRVADQIMRMPDEGSLGKIDDEIIQRKQTDNQAPVVTPGIESGINSLKGGGQPLPESTRSFFETRFGHDFNQVRIHHDSKAAKIAKSVNAKAFTSGKDVVFAEGQYAPQTTTGKQLLAHELTHVIQQDVVPIPFLTEMNKRNANDTIGKSDRSVINNVMRATPSEETRTYLVIYGSGQLSPNSGSFHNLGAFENGGLFYMAARTKRDDIKKRIGNNSPHEIVFEYAPTEIELKEILNKDYANPIAEVHIYSHGFSTGVNLGGRIPGDNQSEKPDPLGGDERRIKGNELGEYNINFAKDATVTFYGCNIGNATIGMPFAQEFSNEFGVTVEAFTRGTQAKGNVDWKSKEPTYWYSPGGEFKKFTPDQNAKQASIIKLKHLLKLLGRYTANRDVYQGKLNSSQDSTVRKKHQIKVNEYCDKIEKVLSLMKRQINISLRMSQFIPNPLDKKDYVKALEDFLRSFNKFTVSKDLTNCRGEIENSQENE